MAVLLFLVSGVPVIAQKKDSVHYAISDRRSDAFSSNTRNPFSIRDTSLIKQTIEYDPKTQQYVIVEKVAGKIYRTPTTLSFDEFYRNLSPVFMRSLLENTNHPDNAALILKSIKESLRIALEEELYQLEDSKF